MFKNLTKFIIDDFDDLCVDACVQQLLLMLGQEVQRVLLLDVLINLTLCNDYLIFSCS